MADTIVIRRIHRISTGRTTMNTMKCYFYPIELTPENILTDGATGAPIELKGLTQLIWMDLNPHLKFVHPTAYMLAKLRLKPTSGEARFES
jgi:hypothetical protein